MPTSYHEAISRIVGEVVRFQPRSVLDLGVGFGKYGVLLREALDVAHERYHPDDWKTRIDGIEGWSSYRNPLHDHAYDEVRYGRIQDTLPAMGTYDVAILVDVLEHFDHEEGLAVLSEALRHVRKALIVSTPVEPAEQGAVAGNPLEEHRSRWTARDFAGMRADVTTETFGREAALVVVLYPEGAPRLPVPDATRERLAAVDAVWDSSPEPRPLRVALWLPHQGLTGGAKVMLDHARELRARGHRVAVAAPSVDGTVVPPWSDLTVDEQIALDPTAPDPERLRGHDVVVATYFRELPFLTDLRALYLEQGHEALFGDVARTAAGADMAARFDRAMLLPIPIAAVSPHVAERLQDRYARRCAVVPNGVDTERFVPGDRERGARVLLVGNPTLPFKGFDVALRVLEEVRRSVRDLRVTWVCQSAPTPAPTTRFPLELVPAPPQEHLPALYRAHDALLFTSRYEGFGLPPLEAMASGVPVVATRCGGIDSYARPGENCLLARVDDVPRLATALRLVLRDQGAAEELARAGRQTALQFSLARSTAMLELALAAVAGA